jgi:capsule polysaccharide export protein KpsE/RkpR
MTNLADRYAFLKDEIDALTKQLDKVRAEIKATGREQIVGERAIVTVSLCERTTFDAKAAKAFLTDNEIAACERVTLVETLRVKPRVEDIVL